MRPAVLYGLETEVAQLKLRFSLGVTRVARIYEFHVVKEDIWRVGVSEEDVTDRVHDLLWTDKTKVEIWGCFAPTGPGHGQNWVNQDDNDPNPSSKSTTEWLKKDKNSNASVAQSKSKTQLQ